MTIIFCDRFKTNIKTLDFYRERLPNIIYFWRWPKIVMSAENGLPRCNRTVLGCSLIGALIIHLRKSNCKRQINMLLNHIPKQPAGLSKHSFVMAIIVCSSRLFCVRGLLRDHPERPEKIPLKSLDLPNKV